MWEDMLKNEEPDWKPQLGRMLREAKKHHKEASNSFFRLKKKLKEKDLSEDDKRSIDVVDTFITYFPAGGATVHDLLMFLEERVL
tara:strand:+ start:192 stop:446 length:255 start_codon:yes stop_codon:yes gene_type:complete